MKSKHYQLTALPKSARTPVGWVALCFFALIFSPFVGFAILGKVETPGLIIGLKFAILPVLGMTAIAIGRWLVWRRLPPELVREWMHGKVVPADGAPMVVPPVRFADGDCWIRMSRDAVTASKQTLISMQGVPQTWSKVRAVTESGEVSAPWSDVIEWTVETDSDGPNYQSLHLRGGGRIKLRRFAPKHVTESDLLDVSRGAGTGCRPTRRLDRCICCTWYRHRNDNSQSHLRCTLARIACSSPFFSLSEPPALQLRARWPRNNS